MKKSSLAVVPVTLVSILFVVSGGAARADRIDDFVLDQMQSKQIPGMALAVVRDGEPVKVRGFGRSSLELDAAVTTSSVFPIASVSKQIIAASIMMLVDEERLDLDDRAVSFLDDAPEAWRDITVEHLLTHTSGLIREGPGFEYFSPTTDAELIASAYAEPLLFQPGDQWQYSNLGYSVLAEIISQASGQPWPSFIDEHVFDPLGMEATGVVDASRIVSDRVSGYAYREGSFQNVPLLLALRPSGAFMSSIEDLIKWDAALDRPGLLSQEAMDAMWTAVELNDDTTYPYGFGFEIGAFGTHRVVSHGGSMAGFRSYYLRLPDDELSVIILTNNEAAPADAIARGVAHRYVDGLFPEYEFQQLTESELDALTGSYRLSNDFVITVNRNEMDARGLHASAAGFFDFSLLPASTVTFFSPDDPRVHFEFEREDTAIRMILYNENGPMIPPAIKD